MRHGSSRSADRRAKLLARYGENFSNFVMGFYRMAKPHVWIHVHAQRSRGSSLREIAETLTDRGETTFRGRLWTAGGLTSSKDKAASSIENGGRMNKSLDTHEFRAR